MPSRSRPVVAHPPVGTVIDNAALQLVEVLGVGGYGVVYRAIDTQSASPKSYAVKCLMFGDQETIAQRQTRMREITLHQLASGHRSVVTMHRIIEDLEYGCTYIVMDFASDGDLFSQILHNCRYLGNDYLIRHVFLQLLDAVEYIHSLGIFHRDLKPENVLCFDGGLRIALTDFGLATTSKSSQEFRTGSVYHMSPECRGGEFAPSGSYSPRANDMWSLGIIFLNLATGRNPWKSASLSDSTFQAYLQNPDGFLQTVLPISDEFNVLLVRMLELDWRDRMTIPELRLAMEDVHSFYGPGTIFDGSMARCSWEGTLRSASDESYTKDESFVAPPAVPPSTEVQSRWSDSSASAIVFASRKRAASASSYESWSGLSNSSSEDMDVSVHRPGASQSSPSLYSQCSSTPSWPDTPSDLIAPFTSRMGSPPPTLSINTNYSRSQYYNCHDAERDSYSSSDSDLIMQTAVDDSTYASSRFFEENTISPSKSLPSKTPTREDREISTGHSESFWQDSVTQASFSFQDDEYRIRGFSQESNVISYEPRTSIDESSPETILWPEHRCQERPTSSHLGVPSNSDTPASPPFFTPDVKRKTKASHLFINPAKYLPRPPSAVTDVPSTQTRTRARANTTALPPSGSSYRDSHNYGRAVRHWFRANKKHPSPCPA